MNEPENMKTSFNDEEISGSSGRYRNDNIVSEDLLKDLRIDDDHFDDEDREAMAGHMRHWSIIALVLGIVFGFLHYKRHEVMTLEESRVTLIGSIVLIAASLIFLIADRRERKKDR